MALLAVKNITKTYPGVVALNDVSIEVEQGEVHALMGENGAGKSTLIKVVAGAVAPDSGTVQVSDARHKHLTPKLSRSLGIEVIYQELNLVPRLSVAENICLGDRISGRFYEAKTAARKAKALLDELSMPIDPGALIDELSMGQRQMVEIAKAVSRDLKILIMDEPTSSLSEAESIQLLKMVGTLKARGVTVVYISHRIDEVFQIADRVSVLRDGRYIATRQIEGLTRHELVSLMVGRELVETYPTHESGVGDVALSVTRLSGDGFHDISFDLRRGEVLGVAGLVGAGRTELARAIFGADKKRGGEVRVFGSKADIASPEAAIALGLGLIPEDRKGQGVLLELPIKDNISIAILKRISKLMVVNRQSENREAARFAEALRIKAPNLSQLVKNLSGGNQQKVALAKWLATDSKVLIFDEPTRGIDVGAKQEIYKLIMSLVDEGIAVMVISSDMEEVMGISDRIMVMCEGRLTGFLNKGEFTQSRILELASDASGNTPARREVV